MTKDRNITTGSSEFCPTCQHLLSGYDTWQIELGNTDVCDDCTKEAKKVKETTETKTML